MKGGDKGDVVAAPAGPPPLLDWKFSQVFGERIAGEEVQEVDIISAIEFDKSGDHLATGDRGGRVVLFERTDKKERLIPSFTRWCKFEHFTGKLELGGSPALQEEGETRNWSIAHRDPELLCHRHVSHQVKIYKNEFLHQIFDEINVRVDVFQEAVAAMAAEFRHFIPKEAAERSALRYSTLNSQSQFLTHTIGRILSEMKVTHTPIDIKGFEKLLQVMRSGTRHQQRSPCSTVAYIQSIADGDIVNVIDV
ncbi:hypothetical protein L2E82_01752 [Cichorium intybus]|uniref:Uncharacterized protein n=1 Tax=Cichorium intybus TaxID=13427 RepID=A0ACB9GZR0_CICIN|nr:hypothetical protein L2E82_01752 [Cichorium intybus]